MLIGCRQMHVIWYRGVKLRNQFFGPKGNELTPEAGKPVLGIFPEGNIMLILRSRLNKYIL